MWASRINVHCHCFWDKMWRVGTTVGIREDLGLDSASFFFFFFQDLRQLLNRLRPAYTWQDLMLAIFYVYRGQLRLIHLTPASWFRPHNVISIWLMENELNTGFWWGLKSLPATLGWRYIVTKIEPGIAAELQYWREKELIEYCKEDHKSCCGNIHRNILWVWAGCTNM